MKPKIHVMLCDDIGERFFGEGPCRLLHRIEETGSLRAAAQAMGLSYSKALRMVKRAEKELGFALTRKTIGGRGGGGSTLTDEARNFMERYEAYRDACGLTASSIISSFRVSGKRHLLLTGGRSTGKTTLLRALVPLLCPGAQQITTAAYPADRVEIRESLGGKIAVIGRFDPALPPGENRMRPVADGFLLLGVPALHRMAAGESEWAVLDELGYLENSCPEFRQAVEALLDAKRVLAIVRKQDTPFLTALCARQDAFVVDLDDPAPALGCVVMASGLGRRFGGNKLMADFCGAPLIANALALAALPLLACRIVVTRSEEVEALCNAQGIPVLRHAQPYRSDTVRLGLAALLGKEPALRGCLFLPGDQPLLTQQSVEALALAAAPDAIVRLCAADGTPGSPVLFGADYFSELLHLPDGRGGNAVARAHPGSVCLVSARNDAELRDVDTREDLNQLRQLTNR